ncbi:MAG: hypothetical protein AB7E47_14600 [Desulfovibrionaceae bacterium]
MTMKSLTETYKGWTIALTPGGDMCSNFAMDITSPDGTDHVHVGTAGLTEERALERGREMVDTRIALA